MKNLFQICCVILFLSLTGTTQASPQIDFSHFVTPQEGVLLAVVNVADDDVLNIRVAPNANAPILYRIPHNADDVITYESNVSDLIGQRAWISVRIGVPDGYINGYAYARYLDYSRNLIAINNGNISARIPYFLESENLASDWMKFYKTESANHYSGCDMRDQPELKHQLSLFEMQLKSYDSLSTALLENSYYDKEKALSYYDQENNWFHNMDNSTFEKRDDFSWSGYRQTIGAEGCGIHTYYYQRNQKILVMKLPFDNNPPMAAGDPLPKPWSDIDRTLLISNILDSVSVRNLR